MYVLLNGVILFVMLLMYIGGIVVGVFLSVVVIFGVMLLVGVFMKKDLLVVGYVVYSVLIGIIIVMLLNMFFLYSNVVEFFIFILMVLIFLGIIVYDN